MVTSVSADKPVSFATLPGNRHLWNRLCVHICTCSCKINQSKSWQSMHPKVCSLYLFIFQHCIFCCYQSKFSEANTTRSAKNRMLPRKHLHYWRKWQGYLRCTKDLLSKKETGLHFLTNNSDTLQALLFKLACDASPYGIRAVLPHWKERPLTKEINSSWPELCSNLQRKHSV